MRKPLIPIVVVLAAVVATGAQAASITYVAGLSGANEAPPNDSLGTGSTTVIYDDAAHTLRVMASFSGLTGTTTAAHIHCCTTVPFAGNIGVATPTPTFPGFPAGVTAGSYDRTFDLTLPSSWNAAFVNANGGTLAGAEAVFGAGLASGRAYLNIHSTYRGGGEIRGFLVPVPEPASAGLLALGVGAVAFGRRRRA